MPQQFPAIRLVALDLDGTLLNREGHVTPRTRAALQAAVDKGEALRALANRLGVPHECTLAVGDSENDRAMLQ